MVFYRTYRPQTIGDLDSASVRDILFAVLSQKSIAHAFLFTGPKGLGKTSTARIVAKVLNCEKKAKSDKQKEIEPCNKCDQCVSITNGTNMDVLEVDGASNRGIDEIRDLREKVRLAPLSSNKKVYIIDEVHMLTTEAFNALLKTLEEPPSHAVFILCTTEPQKVPPTIMSRCFHISFNKATEEELVSSLKRIIKGEKISIDNDGLSFIARLSEGSFRDAAKILEQVAALSNNKKITKKLVEDLYKISNVSQYIADLLELLVLKDTKKALQLIGKLVTLGIDMKYFTEQLISVLHELLLIKVGVKSSKSNPIGLEVSDIKILIELLAKANGELKYAVLPQLPLELAIIEWGEKDIKVAQGPVANGAEVAHKNFLVRSAKKGKDVKPDRSSANAHSENFVSSPRNTSASISPAGNSTFWKEFIEKVKTQNHSIAGVLRSCKLQSFNDTMLVIETAYKFHKDKLSEPKTIKLLEEVAGKGVRVSVVLKVGDKI